MLKGLVVKYFIIIRLLILIDIDLTTVYKTPQ